MQQIFWFSALIGCSINTISTFLPQVMEEGPEAQMETDVSSTTEDVAEAQEVSGSNGNVEMVVIVENVTEDDNSCTEQVTAGDNVVASSSSTIPQPSPQKAISQSPRTSPVKPVSDQKTTKSPNKALNTPTPLSVEHSKNNNSQDYKSDTPLMTSKEESVDISNKVEEQKSPQKNASTPKKLSPIKVSDIHKSPKILINIQKPSTSKEQLQETKTLSSKNNTPEKPALNGTVECTNSNEDSSKNKTAPIQMVVEKEVSNDSQIELNPDVSEKEHNKSISRELKSLIKSAKESKIISECTQLTTKTRKSRAPLDAANSSLNVSVEAEKIKDTRRCSDNSQKSNCSEKSEKVPVKRSMRSQNPEFVNKVKQFLNSVTSKVQKESDEGTDEEVENTNKEVQVNKDLKDSKCDLSPSLPKKKKDECVSILF